MAALCCWVSCISLVVLVSETRVKSLVVKAGSFWSSFSDFLSSETLYSWVWSLIGEAGLKILTSCWLPLIKWRSLSYILYLLLLERQISFILSCKFYRILWREIRCAVFHHLYGWDSAWVGEDCLANSAGHLSTGLRGYKLWQAVTWSTISLFFIWPCLLPYSDIPADLFRLQATCLIWNIDCVFNDVICTLKEKS